MNKAAAKTTDNAVLHEQDVPHVRPQIAANDTLHHELELRWGPAFAQWLIDRMVD